MLAVSWDIVRLFLHVLAATIWVGGQLTLAALAPARSPASARSPRCSWASCWPAEQPLDRQRWPLAGPAGILGFTSSSH